MPRLPGIRKVLVFGSGPIVIGQAAEFDYSGTQACRALREEAVTVVLLNPNPATIMTDKHIADSVYLEPLTLSTATRIIEKEKPDGIIATMGGQAGLNLAMELQEAGILSKLGIHLLGTGLDAIRTSEDREIFKEAMKTLGQPVPTSMSVTSISNLDRILNTVGLPCVVRPAFTLGGTGGGLAGTPEELLACLKTGLLASPIHQVLVESSLYGQKEIEFEVVRDCAGNAITVCSMENLDPVGIHTGDSIVVAPTLTLSDSVYQKLRAACLDIAAHLQIQGACNVQLAVGFHEGIDNKESYNVIEVNPRVSRSSALASKATGYPIARVATKIALGFTLDEIVNEVTGATAACHEPAMDYVAVKIPRWPWDKFPHANRHLGLQMKSTGEVMALGRTFEEALGKAISSLDQKETLWDLPRGEGEEPSSEHVMENLEQSDDTRLSWILKALKMGLGIKEISGITGIDSFFIERIAKIVEAERALSTAKAKPVKALKDAGLIQHAKEMGLQDSYIASLLGVSEEDVRSSRESLGIVPGFGMVDTCAGEFQAKTSYYYSTYDFSLQAGHPGILRTTDSKLNPEIGSQPSALGSPSRPSVIVLGSGPIRIGQGIEFDYCAVHAAWSLQKLGYASIMINSNPETVSTDFNTADRLYFEPLTFEHVKNICDLEKPLGVLVSFGGQTAINLVESLVQAGISILGTPPSAIDITEDRGRFIRLLHDLGIPAVRGTSVKTLAEAIKYSIFIGFPVIVRPSYVLGGRGMAIAHNEDELSHFFSEAVDEAKGHGVLIDKYILATEVEIDVVSDGTDSYIPAIMEHVERAGVHSGDSIAQIPQRSLSDKAKTRIVEYTMDLCRALPVKGIANIQFIVQGDTVFCLEVNPRASRTVPFLTKVTDFPIIQVATGLSLGRSLKSYGIKGGLGPEPSSVAVKMPVFSWSKMLIDPVVGPEMKSTGEVMGQGATLREALSKAFSASQIPHKIPLTRKPSALITVADRDKGEALTVAKMLQDLGWQLHATTGTAAFLEKAGVLAHCVDKISQVQGHTYVNPSVAASQPEFPRKSQTSCDESSLAQNVESLIAQRQVDLVINTFTVGGSEERDGFKIRTLAIRQGIPVITCLDTAFALAKAMAS